MSRDWSRSGTWERVLSCFYAVVSVLLEEFLHWQDLGALRSGCTSVALLDLKQSEVQTAAEELVEFAGTFSQFRTFFRELFPQIPAAGEHLGLDALRIVGLECDVTSEVSVADAFMKTLELFGRVDAVVASAGKFVSTASNS